MEVNKIANGKIVTQYTGITKPFCTFKISHGFTVYAYNKCHLHPYGYDLTYNDFQETALCLAPLDRISPKSENRVKYGYKFSYSPT